MNHGNTEARQPGVTFIWAIALSCAWAASARAQPAVDLRTLREQAYRDAVAAVAPAVVRIETVGGLPRVGNVLFGTGPTTGLIVSEDGYVISSAFNFAGQPTSILVGLPDGTRTPAELIAADKSRMLVLLKVNVSEKLPVPDFVPADEMRVGQTSIAVGRTFDGGEPNVSIGIVSALERIWGKAIQTDAKISPNNYGGPLVDLHGRVLGVLVPLSPTDTGEVAGVEWYDSGIGFAIPLEHVNAVLPRMQQGDDLTPGVVGVSLKGRDMYSDPAEIAVVRPNSPAYRAGLKAGDRIVEIDGYEIARQVQLRHQIQQKYAGDTIRVAVMRDDERVDVQLELVDQLQPYEHPFLGVLPMRAAGLENVVVRYVYADSPAAAAGLLEGDRITQFEGQPAGDAVALRDTLSGQSVGEVVTLTIARGEEYRELEVTLADLSTGIPAELPPPRSPSDAAAPEVELPQTGAIAVKIPEFQNECLAYVPEAYDPKVAYGVVIWLHAPGGFADDELLARWRAHCDSADLILLAPKAAEPERWRPTEVEFIRKTLDQITSTYHVDPSRVVVHGHQSGASMAYLFAFNNRDKVRGVAAVDGPLAGRVAENEPLERLAFYVAAASNSRQARGIAAGVERLRAMKYPVTVVELGEQPRYLNEEEFAALLRWIDCLDRL